MHKATGTITATGSIHHAASPGAWLGKVLGTLAVTLGWACPTVAHHGIAAQFDTSTTFEISGVVTELEFVNPHAYVYFDVTGPSGEVVPWRCELRAAMGMGAGLQPTAAGAAAVEGYQREDNPRFHCMAVNIFADWTFDQHVNRIIQEEDQITLMYGFMDIVRGIHLDMDEHASDIEPSRAGHSIGRWDGDELVVDTVGFAPGYLETREAVMHSEGPSERAIKKGGKT